MIKVKLPATSANLGVGFDSLALSLDLYNIFTITESDEFYLKGFQSIYDNEDNLVLKSFLYTSRLFIDESKMKKATIHLTKEEIPVSRGLGSSSSCILAGVIGANYIQKLNLSLLEIANIASVIETHYDNVFGCVFGGLTASFDTRNKIEYNTFDVSNNLQFTLLIPNTTSATSEMRNKLSDTVSLQDTVFHLSRMIHLPKAFKDGDISLLKELLKDKIHEEIRYEFIPMNKELKALQNDKELIVLISGSGPSILIISNKDIKKKLTQFEDAFDIRNTSVTNGVEIVGDSK